MKRKSDRVCETTKDILLSAEDHRCSGEPILRWRDDTPVSVIKCRSCGSEWDISRPEMGMGCREFVRTLAKLGVASSDVFGDRNAV